MNKREFLAYSPHLILVHPYTHLVGKTKVDLPRALDSTEQNIEDNERTIVFEQLLDMAAQGLIRKSDVVLMLCEISKLGQPARSKARMRF